MESKSKYTENQIVESIVHWSTYMLENGMTTEEELKGLLNEGLFKRAVAGAKSAIKKTKEAISNVKKATKETLHDIFLPNDGVEKMLVAMSKASKDGILKQVVPEIDKLKDQYELLWQMPNNDGYLKLVAIMQKFVDQSISANTNYDPTRFDGQRVPMKVLLKDLLTAYKLGVKTLYYHNTRDGANDAQADMEDDCAGGACKI